MIVTKFLVINSRGSVRTVERTPRLAGNEIAVRLELDIPNQLFERPTLVANMKIPKEAVPKSSITPMVATNVENLIKEATGLEMNVTIIEHEEEDK